MALYLALKKRGSLERMSRISDTHGSVTIDSVTSYLLHHALLSNMPDVSFTLFTAIRYPFFTKTADVHDLGYLNSQVI